MPKLRFQPTWKDGERICRREISGLYVSADRKLRKERHKLKFDQRIRIGQRLNSKPGDLVDRAKLRIAQSLHLRLERIDALDDRLQALHFALVRGTENLT